MNEINNNDIKYMQEALKEAEKAYTINEVPIGAIVVYNGDIIGRGYNKRNTEKSTFAHAEIIAMKQAMEYIGDWRLEDTKLYVTLEPCPMCAGAILQARMKEVIIGAPNYKSGSVGSIINLFEIEGYNHKVEVKVDVLLEESKTIIQKFFRELRKKNKQ